jgi:phage terminase large subunit GpA-like protein
MAVVDTANDAIYWKLQVTTPGPGYCHFPIAYQQEFFNQLTSKEVRTRFVCGPSRARFLFEAVVSPCVSLIRF